MRLLVSVICPFDVFFCPSPCIAVFPFPRVRHEGSCNPFSKLSRIPNGNFFPSCCPFPLSRTRLSPPLLAPDPVFPYCPCFTLCSDSIFPDFFGLKLRKSSIPLILPVSPPSLRPPPHSLSSFLFFSVLSPCRYAFV